MVPTRDRPESLLRLLTSLEALTGTLPEEVVVVDGSSDGQARRTLEAWAAAPHPFKPVVVQQRGPRGPGSARNEGVLTATREVVAFTDDDCLVHPRWLERLLAGLSRTVTTGGVGGRVLPLRDDLVSRYYTFHRILDPPPSKLYLVSANCCFLRDAVLDVGGFDEDIPKPGGEDIGLSFKLSRAGWTFEFSEDAIVYHDYRSSVLDFVWTFRNYGRGCRRVTEKHFGNAEARP